jgi:hypothetical protein
MFDVVIFGGFIGFVVGFSAEVGSIGFDSIFSECFTIEDNLSMQCFYTGNE